MDTNFISENLKRFINRASFNFMRGWIHIDNFGNDLRIYGKGSMRRLVGKNGEIVLEYRVNN